jgi:hypothetical protein
MTTKSINSITVYCLTKHTTHQKHLKVFDVKYHFQAKGKNIMKREDQQDATIRCLLLTSVSTCFGHHYAHLQENKCPVTAFGVLFCNKWESDITANIYVVLQS